MIPEDIPMLSQPLMTEEGFVNPACIQELEAWLANMPTSHERLAGDPKWSTPRWTSCREIVGHFAHWAVRQIDSDVPFPPGLEKMVGYLYACIRPRFDQHGMAELSLCDISRLLHEILMPEAIFQSWNDEKVLPGWLDLDALLHNVCMSIQRGRDEFDEFNRRFEEEHGPFNP